MIRFRQVVLIALMFVASAAPLAAQYWVKPAKTPNTDVKCVNCPCATTSNCSKDKLTAGYPATINTFVGRYLDSQDTNDFQQHYRTARARNVLPMPALGRVYFILGSGVMAYDMDRFFRRLSGGESMTSVKAVPVPWGPYDRVGSPDETLLLWDQFFYAENEPSNGWETQVTDGQERLYYIDVDDKGYVFMAYTLFGWGIAKDDMKSDSSLMTSMFQYKPSSVLADDVQPNVIAVLKTAAGSYYAVVSDATTAVLNVFDVSNRSQPIRQASVKKSMTRFAKTADMTKVGVVTNDGKFQIYTTEALVSGGQAMLSDFGPSGAPVRGAACDGTNFYVASDLATGMAITTYAPNTTGSGYHKVADFLTNRPSYTMNLRYGDGYLAHASITDGGYELRLFQGNVNSVSEVDLKIPVQGYSAYFFKNYYISTSRPGYTAPAFGVFYDSWPVKRSGHTYLIVTAYGLGDVYEVAGSDSITINNGGSKGTVNPNRPAGSSAGPFYGDPVGFTAGISSGVQTNIQWDFGNPEADSVAADPNIVNGVTGQQTTHRYSGITSVASLPLTRTVRATSLSDANVAGALTVTMAKPTIALGIKNYKSLLVQPNASATAPIVFGDSFVDTSDGAAESHFNTWTIDGQSTKATPLESVGVGGCSAHTLSLTAHYGPYTGSSPNEVSLSDLPLGLAGVQYAVRPFAAAITTTSNATDITFSSGSRVTADATVMSAAQLAAMHYKWELLDANNAVLQTGPNGTAPVGLVPSFTVAKSAFTSRGIRAHLVLNSPTPVTGACAGLNLETSEALTQPLNGPDPVLNGDCTAGAPPCSFNVSSASGVNQANDGWTYAWSVSPATGVIAQNTASQTFTPSFSIVGQYTISVTVANAIGSSTVTKNISVTKAGSTCPSMGGDNTIFITYASSDNSCSWLGGNCNRGATISFNVSGGFTYDFSCATHTFNWDFGDGGTATGQTPTHVFNTQGTFTVRVRVANPAEAVTITIPVSVGTTGTPPPTSPPPPTQPPPTQPPPTQPPPTTGCGAMAPDGNVFLGYNTPSYSCAYFKTDACTLGEAVYFYAFASGYDFGCGTHTFTWNYGDGTTATGQNPASHLYATSGSYAVTLTIQSATQNVILRATVKVGTGSGTPPPTQPPPTQPPPTQPPPTQPPPSNGSCAAITPGMTVYIDYVGQTSACTQIIGDCGAGENVAFTVKAFQNQYDFGCAAHTFQWQFDDGTDPVSGQSVTHRFAGAGTYHVKVLLTANGLTTTIPQDVKVSGGGGAQPPPTNTAFPFDFTIAPRAVNGFLIPHEYVFTAYAIGSATTTQYKWTFGDGQTSTSDKPGITHAYSDGLDHTIKLEVSGYNGKVEHTLSPPRRRTAGH